MTTKVKQNQLRETYLEGSSPQVTSILGAGDIRVDDVDGDIQLTLQTELTPPAFFQPYLTGEKIDLTPSIRDGVCFAKAGTKLYLTMDDNTNSVLCYDLTTPYDLSTAVYNHTSDPTPSSFNWWSWVSEDGVRYLWHEIIGAVQSVMHYGYLSTPYDTTTFVEEGSHSFTPNSEGHSLTMINSGSSIIGSYDSGLSFTYSVIQSDEFSTAYIPDSTLQSASVTFPLRRGIRVFAMVMSSDGSTLWSCEGSYKEAYEPVTLVKRELSTAYDLTTVSQPLEVHDLSALDGFSASWVRSMAMNDTGTKLFIAHHPVDGSSGRLSELVIGV